MTVTIAKTPQTIALSAVESTWRAYDRNATDFETFDYREATTRVAFRPELRTAAHAAADRAWAICPHEDVEAAIERASIVAYS